MLTNTRVISEISRVSAAIRRIAAKIQFWLLRELCWWWVVSVMLAVVVDFLRDSPIVRRVSALFGRTPASA